LLAASLIAWRLAQKPSPAPSQLVPLTQDPGGELEPSLSPDGNFVAYAWTGPVSPGAQDIWVKAVDGESRRQLTNTPAPVSENSPAWSPDGKEIAFARVGYGGQSIPNPGVYVISLLGGPERRVSASGRHPKWTPDGRGLLIRDRSNKNRPAGIFLIDLKTHRSRQITQPDLGDGDWKFDISPDGSTLAFIRYEHPGVSDIYTVPMGGGEPARLTNWSSLMSGVAWSPDGREIIFDVTGHSLRRVLARASAPSRGTEVSNLGGLITSAALGSTPSLSRPNRGQPARLAFQLEVINVGLRLVDLNAPPSSGVLQVKHLAEGRRIDIPGPWSPEGERVAFVSYSAGTPAQFRVVRRDGSDLRSINALTASAMNIGSWAPDGRRLALDATVSGNSDIYVVSEDSGAGKRLTTEPSMEVYASWSQDGRWIYYSSNRTGRYEVWRMPADGGAPTQITRNGGIQPVESLDGKHLFYLDQPGLPEIGLASKMNLKMISLQGIEERSLVDLTPIGRLASWGLTTRGIYFVTAEPDFEAIHLLRLTDGSVTQVGRLPFRLPKQFPRMTFSHDGRSALTNRVDRRESDIMMIDNFR
jgi:Tol biopolymer transport system component